MNCYLKNNIENLVKGDSIQFDCLISENITDWKIRCELYDSTGNSIEKATSNSGGSDSQIKITDASNGKFTVYIDKTETEDFEDESNIEIEVELTDGKVYTVYQAIIEFKIQTVDWETPT